MADLSTNYMDDILAESMNGKRKYRITRADGSFEEVTLEDISEYEQRGSVFGAGDINRTNQAVNEKFDSGDVVDPMETTVPGFAADALAVKNHFNEQNKKLSDYDVLLENESASTSKTYTLAKDIRNYKRIAIKAKGHWSDTTDVFFAIKETPVALINNGEKIYVLEAYYDATHRTRLKVIFKTDNTLSLDYFSFAYGIDSVSVYGFYS